MKLTNTLQTQQLTYPFFKFIEKISYILLLVISLWWIYSIASSDTYSNLLLSLEQKSFTIFCFVFLSLIFLTCFLVFPKCRRCVKYVINFLSRKKWIPLLVMFLWQILVLLSFGNVGMGADQEQIRQTALDPHSYSDYLSKCPNNVFIAYIYWLVTIITPDSFPEGSDTVIMQLLGIVVLDISIISSTTIFKRISPKVADIAFFLFLFLFGFSGHILLVYTDIFTIPLTMAMMSCAIVLLFPTHSKKINWRSPFTYLLFVAFGLLTYLSYQMKPSSIIITLAFFIVWAFKCWGRRLLAIFLPSICIFLIGIGLASGIFHIAVNNHMRLNYVPNPYPMSHFMAMGLTDRGGFNLEDRIAVSEFSTEEEKNDYSIKVIKQRLSEYGPTGYANFLLQKAYYTLEDGTFSFGKWDALYVFNNDTEIGGIYKNFRETRLANFIRSFYTLDAPRYTILSILQQSIYLATVIGIALSCIYSQKPSFLLHSKEDNKKSYIAWWLAISLLGAILFLLLFESGRSKYLIQFLPQIILLSSIGWSIYLEKHQLTL